MVVCESSINNIMGGIENTGGVTLHNHRRKLKQRFDIIKKLGQGTYGKVQLGINKETGQEVAIKTIKKCKIETEADLIRIRREIQIMSSVQHPNIIHIYEVFENREKMVLVMEYAAGGELYDYLSERKVLTEDEARRIFRQIATAVYYCHKHKICHRDLKLENILLDEHGSAKIADFGLSNVFDDRRLLSTFCGSPLYASPEIVKGTPYHGPEVDCWSLGVLLYTLVYGAMPFDGSNFKRLVKQISQGDYFEPKKPSSASPLIREMLTVLPENRANIEKICTHWWVNQSYPDSCLEIAEDLANQTPVRLDLLLSLAPPPPPVGGDKMVIAGESSSVLPAVADSSQPARSQSVGSLMDLVPSAERRIRDLVTSEDQKSPKRKLEVTVSTDHANLSNSGAKRKEKPEENTEKPENTEVGLVKNLTQTVLREENEPKSLENEKMEEFDDPNLQGAACSELIEESKKNEEKIKKKVVKIVKKPKEQPLETKNSEKTEKIIDKENKTDLNDDKKEDTKIPVKRKVIKKVLTDKISNILAEQKQETKTEESPKKEEEATPPVKPIVRRQSKIFEQAEKFQNLQNNESKTSILEKPKKIFIPGVNVGGFKKEFERKASLTAVPDLKKLKKPEKSPEEKTPEEKEVKIEPKPEQKAERTDKPEVQEPETKIEETEQQISPLETPNTEEKTLLERKKTAVDIISNAISKEGTRKSKSRPCVIRKPPVPFGINGRSASGSINLISTPYTPKQPEIPATEESVTSSAEITLKSATLPRRKTTKAEIKLDYPPPKPATMEFKTEMAHRIEKPEMQRSEIIVPVNNRRSTSLDPEKPKILESPKERIIPISFERDNGEKQEVTSPQQSKPPMPKPFQQTRPVQPQRFGSISRQSTHDSDTETTTPESMEPIRKSPREYIIPIAVEGGGYVTPRATSLEPSETASTLTGRRSLPKFRTKKMGENGSEEDLSFSSLHRHNSIGRDSDNEDSRREPFHMHRLRSSRPTRKTNLEHADSLSSGEEDDDDGFEILTAENLFSTLLSRVRSLTQRLNVEDNGRLFPNSRLLGNFDHGSKLWNLHNDPLSRFSPLDRFSSTPRSPLTSGAPWRRSVSRDLATDIERVFSDAPPPSGATATLPREKSRKPKKEPQLNLDLSEFKLTDEDAIALSYLTPGLSRRIQTQLLSQLPTARKEKPQKKEPIFSDSSDSDIFSRNSDMDEYNFPRPPKHSSSYTRASNYSPIDEAPVLPEVESKPLNIYRLEDIKKEYNIDKNKYTPFKNCYRSTSMTEPNSSYKNSSYYRSESFDSKTSKYNTINPRTYNYLKEESDESVSNRRNLLRYAPQNYYDTSFSKERKKRELETQKVLKEIRNKRINDYKHSKDGKSTANLQENEVKIDSSVINNPEVEADCKVTNNVANDYKYSKEVKSTANLQENDTKIDSSVKNEVETDCKETNNVANQEIKQDKSKNIKREGKISKLMRPKSYPTEFKTETSESKSKLKKRSPSAEKSDKSTPPKEISDSKKSNNQFLSSIEKKIRSFYSESPEKTKNDVNSRIQTTIRNLREQSEPRNIEHPVTESGLIKRAVSSEDFSVFGGKTPNLQSSKKSVSKILGLFKKYEDKPKNKEDSGKKNKNSVDGINKKIKTKTDTKVKKDKKMEGEINNLDAKKVTRNKITSKLPVRGLETELPTDRHNFPKKCNEVSNSFNNETSNNNEHTTNSYLRHNLSLNIPRRVYNEASNISDNVANSTNLFSPDESNDSWSICSDFRQDLSPNENRIFSEDESNESVSDRIRRKSFYCRFNEKKKPRKTSLDYTKYELKYPEVSAHKKSLKNYDDGQSSSKNDPKMYKRSMTMNDNYYNYPKCRESSIPLNVSNSEKSVEYNNEKSFNSRPKRSLLKTPTKISDRVSMSPPLQDFDNSGPSTSNYHQTNNIPAPL